MAAPELQQVELNKTEEIKRNDAEIKEEAHDVEMEDIEKKLEKIRIEPTLKDIRKDRSPVTSDQWVLIFF